MDSKLNPMTDVEQDYYDWCVENLRKNGQDDNPEIPHIYRMSDNRQEVILFMSHAENFARQYSDGSNNNWCIDLADGTKCYYDEKSTRTLRYGKHYSTAGNYPHASYAMGGDVSDIPFMKSEDERLGAPDTHYNHEGDPVFTDKKHRRDYCRAHSAHDRNGGYSDP